MAGGFCPVYEEGVPPGNDQFHAAGLQDELSVNVTELPTTTVVGAPVKFAIMFLTVMYPVFVSVSVVTPSDTVSDTSYTPGAL